MLLAPTLLPKWVMTSMLFALVVLPWIGAALDASYGPFLSPGHGDFLFLAPPVILAIRGIGFELVKGYSSLYRPAPIAAGVVLAVIYAVMSSAVWKQKFKPRDFLDYLTMAFLTPILLAGAGYAFGSLTVLNAIADSSAPVSYPAVIKSKWISIGSGRSASTHYNLGVSPWGPRTEEDHFRVRPEFFAKVAPGQSISVSVRDGRFGWPWIAGLSSSKGESEEDSTLLGLLLENWPFFAFAAFIFVLMIWNKRQRKDGQWQARELGMKYALVERDIPNFGPSSHTDKLERGS